MNESLIAVLFLYEGLWSLTLICCRSRVKKVYTAYSRKPIEEVWQNVVDLHVQYLIVQMNWCNDRSRSEFKQAIYLFLARIYANAD